ncbi:MAG: pilus assembly protein [Anaerolineae bacterium]|nr:pilus assembly protein [Anaerolineae bacterium]
MSRAQVPAGRKARLVRPRELGERLTPLAGICLLLMLLTLGVMDLSRAVYVHSMVASAAREGARLGSIEPDNVAAIVQAATERVVVLGVDPGDPAAFDVTVTRPDSEHVQVDVACRFVPVTLLVAHLTDRGSGPGITLRARSMMRVER